MASLNQNKLYDPVRRAWVAATPEEQVRQRLLRQLIDQLGYPVALMAVEKELRALPHLAHHCSPLPRRRADLIVFAPGELEPLLLVECKAVPLTPAVINQALGYNFYVAAPVVAILNSDAICTAWWRGEDYVYKSHLPAFDELCRFRYASPLPGERPL
jgi:hypothetical protein